MNKRKVLANVLAGSRNIRFGDFVNLIEGMGFRLARVNGSHHIFQHPDVPEAVNVQDVKGEAKPYQIRQVVELIEEYGLSLETETDSGGDAQANEK